ncbi:MAG: heme o synthase [Paenibacillaceae bacterium]|uniref:heme o synthase n=1 Tax=Paenibacillus cymbidii TaxID=1639034 RepID=UPI00107FEB79|nr:heme o synthase [Paenibacillus cymbidii]MBO9606909.1 heme o synthase [Paenibacillaceae bacterium]
MDNQVSLDDRTSFAGAASAPEEQAAVKPATWRDFVHLAKPGILFSNLITAVGGFWIASKWDIDGMLMLWTMLGTVLVMASGCVLNNYLDRDMDIKMSRTKKRATATGAVKPGTVLVYGITLGVAGLAMLQFLAASSLAALLGLLGLFVYVWVYTAWLKRTSVWSTVIGGISGAVPPVIGYCAVTNEIDAGAWILFAIMFLWQPPHFWALGIRRREEYRAAGYPLLPVVHGVFPTKISMVRYVVLLVPASLLLYMYDYVGEIYLFAAAIMGLIWTFMSVAGFRAKDEDLWAKRMFMYSINYLTLLFLIMVIDTNGL